MDADKRSTHTDALATLGTIIGIGADAARDAIHLAVEPVIAGERVWRGQHVFIQDGKAYANGVGKRIGIVDPFVAHNVEAGERFWLVVYPRLITSFRHVWEHPDFPAEQHDTPNTGPALDDDSWIPWAGAKCPVERGTLVDVKYLDGVVAIGVPALTGEHGKTNGIRTATYWGDNGHRANIIAYRLYDPARWIAWGGGECPVSADTLVKVKLLNGFVDCYLARHCEWQHYGNGGDIVAYRFLT